MAVVRLLRLPLSIGVATLAGAVAVWHAMTPGHTDPRDQPRGDGTRLNVEVRAGRECATLVPEGVDADHARRTGVYVESDAVVNVEEVR